MVGYFPPPPGAPDWNDITGKPTSTPQEIDGAVATAQTLEPHTVEHGAATVRGFASTTGTTYPPTGNKTAAFPADVYVNRGLLGGGNYTIIVGLWKFERKSAPAGVSPTAARFSCTIGSVTNTDARAVQFEWYVPKAGTPGVVDWEQDAQGTAGTFPLAGLSAGANTFTLDTRDFPASGDIWVRVHITGGEPTGHNRLIITGIPQLETDWSGIVHNHLNKPVLDAFAVDGFGVLSYAGRRLLRQPAASPMGEVTILAPLADRADLTIATVNGAVTLSPPLEAPYAPGDSFLLALTDNGGGPYAITPDAIYEFSDDLPEMTPPEQGKTNYYAFLYTGTKWRLMSELKGF